MRVLDLFSGIGGFSLGLERAGFETVAFCEIDKKCHKVLNKHWPDVPIFEDVCTLTKELLDDRGITVDVICGGFPCQDISLAGKGAGIEGERSGLWTEYARIISELRPKFVIVENVAALLSRGLDRVLGDLAEIGYDAEWHCIPASAVGAPHRRDRIWIVAYPNKQWDKALRGECPPSKSESFGGRIIRTRSDGDVEREKSVRGSGENSSNVAYAMREGLEGQLSEFGQAQRPISKTRFTVLGSHGWIPRTDSQWKVEPSVGRVVDGVSGRVDRLQQLGNAVVPQRPELIGRAIMSC
jgi:DNA (cytosine-5)-methyltransferase 1